MAKNHKTNNDKEEKNIEKFLPFGVMIGIVAGSILGVIIDNMMFLLYGTCGGLLFGILIGTIASNGK